MLVVVMTSSWDRPYVYPSMWAKCAMSHSRCGEPAFFGGKMKWQTKAKGEETRLSSFIGSGVVFKNFKAETQFREKKADQVHVHVSRSHGKLWKICQESVTRSSKFRFIDLRPKTVNNKKLVSRGISPSNLITVLQPLLYLRSTISAGLDLL